MHDNCHYPYSSAILSSRAVFCAIIHLPPWDSPERFHSTSTTTTLTSLYYSLPSFIRSSETCRYPGSVWSLSIDHLFLHYEKDRQHDIHAMRTQNCAFCPRCTFVRRHLRVCRRQKQLLLTASAHSTAPLLHPRMLYSINLHGSYS